MTGATVSAARRRAARLLAAVAALAMALGLLLALAERAARAQPAGLIDATDPSRILAVAARFGAAELTTSDNGDPLIVGEIDGVDYSVFFHRCVDGAGCRNIRFYAGWFYKDATLIEVNAFNRDRRFGTAYIDEAGDLNVEMNVNLDFGVAEENLIDMFDWWRVVLATFRRDFGL